MNLPAPQLTILASLARFGVLSADQVTRLRFGRSESFVRPHCRALLDAGLVRASYIPQETDRPGGRPLRVYSLSRRGARVLEGVEPIHVPTLKTHYALKHALMCADLVILPHQLANRYRGYEVANYYTEFDLKRLSDMMPFVPDGYTHLLTPHRSLPIIWEADRDTETRLQLLPKMEKLIACIGGMYQRLYGVDSITVAFVAESATRANQLRGWCKHALLQVDAQALAGNFLFASLDRRQRTDPARVFNEPIWQTPLTDEPIILDS